MRDGVLSFVGQSARRQRSPTFGTLTAITLPRQPEKESRAFTKQKVEGIMLRNALLSSVALVGWLGLAAGAASAYDHHGGYGRHHHHHSQHSYGGYSQVQVYRPQVVVVPSYGYPQSSCHQRGYSGPVYGGYGGYGSPYGGMGYGGGSGFGLYYSR